MLQMGPLHAMRALVSCLQMLYKLVTRLHKRYVHNGSVRVRARQIIRGEAPKGELPPADAYRASLEQRAAERQLPSTRVHL